MQRFKINECTRCNGNGYISKWKHIAKGICFECEGENGYVSTSHSKLKRGAINKELYNQQIIDAIASDDSVLSGRFDLLNDHEVLRGMASLAEEGFDDEILADFAHQMSKR
jgi:hypothetical protein